MVFSTSSAVTACERSEGELTNSNNSTIDESSMDAQKTWRLEFIETSNRNLSPASARKAYAFFQASTTQKRITRKRLAPLLYTVRRAC